MCKSFQHSPPPQTIFRNFFYHCVYLSLYVSRGHRHSCHSLVSWIFSNFGNNNAEYRPFYNKYSSGYVVGNSYIHGGCLGDRHFASCLKNNRFIITSIMGCLHTWNFHHYRPSEYPRYCNDHSFHSIGQYGLNSKS